MHLIYCVLFLILAMAAPGVHAAQPGNQLSPILPWTGSYYDRTQGGSGLIVDIGPSGLMFVTFATYDTEGRQVNWIAEVPYEPTSNVERAETGVIGVAHANFYQAANGQCPGCPYQAPDRNFVGETATFVWETPRHVVMTLDNSGYVYNFLAVNMESRDDDEFLDGTWSVTVEIDQTPDYPDIRYTVTALVTITPATFTTDDLALTADAHSAVVLPPAGASLHMVECAQNSEFRIDQNACRWALMFLFNGVGLGQPLTDRGLVWVDPATHTAGMEVVHQGAVGYLIGPSNWHHDLYVEPNRLQSRSLAQGDAVSFPAVLDGDMAVGATWTRVREGAVRHIPDYMGGL